MTLLDLSLTHPSIAGPTMLHAAAMAGADHASSTETARGSCETAHRFGALAQSLLNGCRVHPQVLPDVAVEVFEAPLVHEAVVLGLRIAPRACRERRLHQLLH